MPGLLEKAGSQSVRPSRWAPIFIENFGNGGLYTNRSPLTPAGSLIENLYYGGKNSALIGGSNVEVTVRNTIQRRPGLSAFSTATYPTAPTRAFSFELLNGTIQVLIDTGSTGSLTITSVANSIGSTAVYTGTFPNAGSNAYAGLVFQVAGFSGAGNNGTFTCTASTTTTLTLTNAIAVAESHAATTVSAGAVYFDQQNGAKTLLKAKQPGAGQSSFVAVAGIFYAGDGVDTWVYTPNNQNGSTWNWGLAAPTSQPSVTIVPSGAAATQWTANTVWSTMGLLNDGTNIQQLIGVNATGLNTTQFGTSGDGNPAWNQTPGGTTSDNTITWTNRGPVVLWTANTTYNNASVGGTTVNPCIIYDPNTKSCYVQANPGNASGVSGSNYPSFKPGLGQATHEGGIKWFYVGPPGVPLPWIKSHAYPSITGGADSVASIVEPVSLANGLPSNQTIFWQVSSGGTSASSAAAPKWATIPGTQTTDGDLQWLCLGSKNWAALTAYSAWSANGTVFRAIVDSNSNFQVCTTTGVSGGSAPTWATVYGDTTTDGSVVWTCVGSSMTWAAATKWFLPVPGFSPPSSSSPYGGASVVDSNNHVEFCTISGKGGSTAPAWAGIGSFTTDNAATWFDLEAYNTSAHSLSWTKGMSYAYSFKARANSDFYSTVDPSTNALPVPPGVASALPLPSGSLTGDVSSASPVFTITGSDAGAVNTISGFGSTNPAVDTIVIWRSADGGSSAQMFELTEIPAPPPIGGIAQFWSFQDFLPDTPTSLYPGLNPLSPAPIDGVNDPPPSAARPMEYNFQRIWCASGQQVIFSGGPDTLVGNPNSAFNASDEFPYLSQVTRAVKSTQGLIVYTKNSIEVILGGPLTASFYNVTLAPGIGLGNFNALDVFAGEHFFMSTDGMLRVLSPSLSLSSTGFPIADKLAALDPTKVYITYNEQPNDSAVYVSDGSTGWFRLNPRQVPGGINGPEPVWSPFATITNGCKMLQSVEVSPGIKKLLVGSTGANQQILQRNLSVFTDNGSQYGANFQLGNLWLAHRGEIALLKFLEADFTGASKTTYTVGYLLNEISGSFSNFVMAPLFDPPSLYGTTITPSSYSPCRYYFSGQGSLARCVHLQMSVDFGTTSFGDEILNMTIYGAVVKNQ